MSDYIDVLLCHLAESHQEALSGEYFRAQARASQALDTLWATLSQEQRKLFRSYELVYNEASALSEEACARQAFLLVREIFR